MPRVNIDDLAAFVAVARERSFRKAAALLGMSQSTLSHTIRCLEARLGTRLLTRTSRSVSPTDAGQRLFAGLTPLLAEIDAQLAALSVMLDKPAGAIRISTSGHAADTVLWPRIKALAPRYPEIRFDLIVDDGPTDIAAQGFDAGVCLGESVAQDMIAVRIGPDLRFAVVGAPAYFEHHSVPAAPHELASHNCINIPLMTAGGRYAWQFQKSGQTERVKVEGQFVLNMRSIALDAVLDGLALGLFFADVVQPYLQQGRLVQVLQDWCQPFAGYHLYYPSRRHSSPVFELVLNALRWRGA